MKNWSTFSARSSCLAVLALAGCSAQSPEPTDTQEQPWFPCGEQTVIEHPAQDTAALVLADWPVGDVLALLIDGSLDLEWGEWDTDYLGPAPAMAQTQLAISFMAESAVVTGYAHSIQDDFCDDWIDISVPVSVMTSDGELMGAMQAQITLTPDLDETKLELLADAQTLGLMTLWPVGEARPAPDTTSVRIELSAPQLGLGSQLEGVVEIVRTWSTTGAFSTSTELLATVG